MNTTTGFTKQQKKEMVDILNTIFEKQFNDVILLGFEDITLRIDKIEKQMVNGFADMKDELNEIKRKIRDLENDTASFSTVIGLRHRIEILEAKVGIKPSN